MCNAHKAAQAYYTQKKRERLAKKSKRRPHQVRHFAGFATYRDYLRSDLWQDIRERVLDLHDRTCRLCSCVATQVHHRHYGIRTLTGKTPVHLLPVCGGCHVRIEFDPDGKKRTAKQAESWLKEFLSKVDSTPSPGKRQRRES
jgi:hypothetical protein